MAYSSIPSARHRERRLLASTVTLALWRLRRTWGLLTVTGVGMVAAVMLVCAVPLYSQVAMTVGLHAALAEGLQNLNISVSSATNRISFSFAHKVTGEVNAVFKKELGSYLVSSRFFLQSDVYFITQNKPGRNGGKHGTGTPGAILETNNQLRFMSVPTEQVALHLHLVSGRLPRASGEDVEIVLAAESAQKLHVGVGSVIPIDIGFTDNPVKRVVVNVPVHVVGLFSGAAVHNDPYWQSLSLLGTPRGSIPPGIIYTGLVSEQAFQTAFMRIASDPRLRGLVPEEDFTYNWSYHLNASKVTLNTLNDLIAAMNHAQSDIVNIADLNNSSNAQPAQVFVSYQALWQFQNRLPLVQIAVMILLVLVLGLVLFFVSMMADLLVDSQSEVIALLRSRGASRSQIFGAIFTQGVGIGLIALIVGPPLAYLSVYMISLIMFSGPEHGLLGDILDNPWQALWEVRWYALVMGIVVILAMVIATFRATNRDVFSMRRESARSTGHPLWQRLNLDIVFVIVMLTGYGFSLYLTSAGVLDPQLRSLWQTPLNLLSSVCLLLACLLLFLRLFPLLLRLGSQRAARSRTAVPLLALAQMARAPRQSVRMTLLLALSTAFAIFTLVFTASQNQRVFDVSNYEGGADFSGALMQELSPPPLDAETTLYAATSRYLRLPGVLSATLGFIGQAEGGANLDTASIQLRAVDADTFAQTANWSPQDSTLPISSLMTQLASRREAALMNDVLPAPAVVDAAGWNALHLSRNAPFSLKISDGFVLHLVAIAEMQYIPSVTDNAQSGNVNGGVLIDFQTYANLYAFALHNTDPSNLPINYAWLHTRNDPASLANVRKALDSGPLQLSSFYDLRQSISVLNNDPLYLALIVVLTLGAVTALLLALMGNLIASWLSARARLINFAVLRALGTPPHLIAGVLTWEQAIIYTTAIVLGVLFGAILSVLVVPTLVFTSIASSASISDLGNNALYLVQEVPLIQVVVPPSLVIALLALVAICILALGMMVRVVSRSSIGQTLRLSQD